MYLGCTADWSEPVISSLLTGAHDLWFLFWCCRRALEARIVGAARSEQTPFFGVTSSTPLQYVYIDRLPPWLRTCRFGFFGHLNESRPNKLFPTQLGAGNGLHPTQWRLARQVGPWAAGLGKSLCPRQTIYWGPRFCPAGWVNWAGNMVQPLVEIFLGLVAPAKNDI